jgi:uncharacterized zinc-type alcohol dehydrogenase-like protein
MIKAWACHTPGAELTRFEYEPGALPADQVEIEVLHCGICYSDISIIDNEWGSSKYPVVPGHEVVGRISATGVNVKDLTIGQSVGLGWDSGSCLHCRNCVRGANHLCYDSTPTIIGHHGGFASHVRAQALWVQPLPPELPISEIAPLLCGGVTVFSPLDKYNIGPNHRVGVVGIGGLGHLAIKYAKALGCEVIAFTSHSSKKMDAIKFGAAAVCDSSDVNQYKKYFKSIDFLLITTNVSMSWSDLITCLREEGRLHFVGGVVEPVRISAFDLMDSELSISGSPTGSPSTMSKALKFASDNRILPQVEHFPIERVNDAINHLRLGEARFRIVLDVSNAF